MNTSEKLTYVILANSSKLKYWQWKCLEHLADLPVEPVLYIINQSENLSQVSTFSKIKNYPLKNILFKQFLKTKTIEALQEVDFLENNSIEVLNVTARKEGFNEYFPEETIKKIRNLKPDFILRFGFNILKGEILNVAKYGVWSFHHNDEQIIRGGPPVFWEIKNNENYCGVILQKLTQKLDAGIVLQKGKFELHNHTFFFTWNELLLQSAIFVRKSCLDILNGNNEKFEQEAVKTKAKIYKYPNNWTFLNFLIHKNLNKLIFYFRNNFIEEKWEIALINKPIQAFQKVDFLKEYEQLTFGKNEFCADPFGIDINGHKKILFEKYNYEERVGQLFSFDASTSISKKINIPNSKNHHYSYPFTIYFDNKIYVVPECFESKRLDLFEFNSTLNTMQWVKTLVENEDIVDASLIFFQSKWWIFCSKNKYSASHLYIYYSENLFSNFEEHAQNPVKIDVCSARMAGNIFEKEGKLFRPGMNNSFTYGGNIVVHEITHLSETEFEETEVKILTSPSQEFSKGIHTISKFGNQTLIDFKKEFFNLTKKIK